MHIILYSNNKVYSSCAEISKKVHQDFFHFIGAPDRSRTCNRQNRNLILYPIELRAHHLQGLLYHKIEVTAT